jgi:two-component system response regulator CpxR
MTPKTDNSRLPIGHQPEVPKRQILLIDDDQDMAEMLAEYLNPEGYFVHLAHTAEAGLERAKEGGLVLIILDVMLPDRNGFVVLNEIRQKSRIPVIMLTTRSSVADKVSGLESGADDYVAKPFTPVELLASSARTVWRRESPPRFSIAWPRS